MKHILVPKMDPYCWMILFVQDQKALYFNVLIQVLGLITVVLMTLLLYSVKSLLIMSLFVILNSVTSSGL